MRRTIRPILEALEGKCLLSGVGPSGLSVSLTASPRNTSSGTQVVFTFTETNVTNHAVKVTNGPSIDNFVVSQLGKPVWESKTGPQPLFLVVQTLQSNQSITIHGTWDGRSNLINRANPSKEGPSLSGKFRVDVGLNPSGHSTAFVIAKPTDGKPSTHHQP